MPLTPDPLPESRYSQMNRTAKPAQKLIENQYPHDRCPSSFRTASLGGLRCPARFNLACGMGTATGIGSAKKAFSSGLSETARSGDCMRAKIWAFASMAEAVGGEALRRALIWLAITSRFPSRWRQRSAAVKFVNQRRRKANENVPTFAFAFKPSSAADFLNVEYMPRSGRGFKRGNQESFLSTG